MSEKPPAQVWELTIEGRSHRVEARGSMSHRVRWYVDGELIAEKQTMDDKFRLEPEGRSDLGGLDVRFSGLGHGLRATVDGIDLDPEPGSKAAAYEERLRAHPRRYAAMQTAIGVAKVVVPIVVALLLARLAFRLPLPDWDLPNLPWPDLPDIPWPDLPSPNLPDISLPGWVRWLLDHAKYVGPVLVAVALAQREVKRRQKQDRLRAELRAKERDEERTED